MKEWLWKIYFILENLGIFVWYLWELHLVTCCTTAYSHILQTLCVGLTENSHAAKTTISIKCLAVVLQNKFLVGIVRQKFFFLVLGVTYQDTIQLWAIYLKQNCTLIIIIMMLVFNNIIILKHKLISLHIRYSALPSIQDISCFTVGTSQQHTMMCLPVGLLLSPA